MQSEVHHSNKDNSVIRIVFTMALNHLRDVCRRELFQESIPPLNNYCSGFSCQLLHCIQVDARQVLPNYKVQDKHFPPTYGFNVKILKHLF